MDSLSLWLCQDITALPQTRCHLGECDLWGPQQVFRCQITLKTVLIGLYRTRSSSRGTGTTFPTPSHVP